MDFTPSEPAAGLEAPRAAFAVAARLAPHLCVLMGRSGVQALVARALVLTTAEVPWMAAVRVAGDGELEGLESARGDRDAAAFAEGEVVLVARLLGLLVAFIGPALTRRLIIQIWPELPFNDTDFGETGNHEKAE